MKKLLFAATIFALAILFNGCSQDPSVIESEDQQIAQLQSIVESQNEEINDLNEQNEGLTSEVSQLQTQIDEYEIDTYEEPLP